MPQASEIEIINAPVVFLEGTSEQGGRSGIIYSITLDNGMIMTSPESFESICVSASDRLKRTPITSRQLGLV